MILIRNIKVNIGEDLRDVLEKKLKSKNFTYKIYKHSIDARREVYHNYQVLVDGDRIKLKGLDWEDFEEENFETTSNGNGKTVTVVGAGPSGLFVAYFLAEHGAKVNVIERGSPIEVRAKEVERLMENGILNVDSNIQFGEGGAGTFSDGKLTSRSKDKRSHYVFDVLVKHGAPEDILYEKMPHAGTDVLRQVIINMRKYMESIGVKFFYNEKFEEFIYEENSKGERNVVGIKTTKNSYLSDYIVLALGNSARDTFEYLNKEMEMKSKPFAVGFRIEHLQEYIDKTQYKEHYKDLPRASYTLRAKSGERSIYTFCMCPGGVVVPEMSEENTVVVNGMSYHARDLENGNSAVVVTVDENDYGNGNLDGMYFQREIEKKTYDLGGGDYHAPVMLARDFVEKRETKEFKNVKPSYKPGFKIENLWEIYPKEISEALREGLIEMDRKMEGFLDGAVLTGCETRTSSPVRIVRDENMKSSIENVYPIGEGAGYAGGIISSAIDGVKCAIEILEEKCH